MTEDHWIFVADAADFFETPDACMLINQAWKLGTDRFRGVRPGETESVEIPSNEAGKIDCDASRVVDGLFTTYVSVMMRWADAKRLAPAAVELLVEESTTPASPLPQDEPQSATSAAAMPVTEAGRAGGKKSGEIRRAGRKWVPHATELGNAACSRNPNASHESVAGEIAFAWKLPEERCPAIKTLSKWVSEERQPGGALPPRSGSRGKRSGSGG
jgi:hypothetical protein